jgi:hypothetical protein
MRREGAGGGMRGAGCASAPMRVAGGWRRDEGAVACLRLVRDEGWEGWLGG